MILLESIIHQRYLVTPKLSLKWVQEIPLSQFENSTMKVAVNQPKENNSQGPTRTSQFLLFLVKICLIPVVVKKNKIAFKIASLKTLLYFIGTFGWFGWSLAFSYFIGTLETFFNHQLVCSAKILFCLKDWI